VITASAFLCDTADDLLVLADWYEEQGRDELGVVLRVVATTRERGTGIHTLGRHYECRPSGMVAGAGWGLGVEWTAMHVYLYAQQAGRFYALLLAGDCARQLECGWMICDEADDLSAWTERLPASAPTDVEDRRLLARLVESIPVVYRAE